VKLLTERPETAASGRRSRLHTRRGRCGLKQGDVAELFGSKGVASEVLRGKRGIGKAQARRLADFFGVSAGLFI
jgi:HTH-type transcriptional regulator/antitoxin HigA